MSVAGYCPSRSSSCLSSAPARSTGTCAGASLKLCRGGRNLRPLLPGAQRGKAVWRPGTEGGPAGSRLTPREVRQLLASHNRARTEVALSPLTWSTKLAVYAQEWADHLASTSRRMEHRPHSGRWKQEHGENLFMGTAGYYGVADAVAMWEGEKRVYDGRAVDQYGVHSFGHYTQLIWRGTRDVGCAKAFCSGYMIVVCNYNPPGNVLGMRPY